MIKIVKSLLLALFLSPALATAGETCQKVLAVGATQATGPTSFAGDAVSSLGLATVYVTITGSKPNADGSINAQTAHTFMIGSQIFTTRDRARLVPLNERGLYRLDTQAAIVDGGWGHLKLNGLLDFATGAARWLAEGEVCSP